ncbi:hypothetical protein [Mucilaginibacter flavidus]|uniref:hypothetical protein n=1 Tax=Mucilaginibacter flavidus TaxID=2949309 RepID=UPI002093467C|nr:hypothetical protein [Mucilaginibacter flavidus]MCO5945615.1 hypothetical protein [Mucilaginibacter flavidus]
MNFNTALKSITSIESNLDGDIKYSYDLTNINTCKLIMLCSDGAERHLTFKLKKEIKRRVYVNFICNDFRIDFPLMKGVERFKFGIKDFTIMLSYGIKSDKISPNGNFDIEF